MSVQGPVDGSCARAPRRAPRYGAGARSVTTHVRSRAPPAAHHMQDMVGAQCRQTHGVMRAVDHFSRAFIQAALRRTISGRERALDPEDRHRRIVPMGSKYVPFSPAASGTRHRDVWPLSCHRPLDV